MPETHGAVEITDEAVRRWLIAAGAREPWTEGAIALAVANLEPIRQMHHAQRLMPKPRLPVERAQKAVNELRNALTVLNDVASAEYEGMGRMGLHEGPIGENFREQMANVKNMLAALVDFPKPGRPKELWKLFATTAYDCLCLIIEDVTISRVENNVAVSFVLEALADGGFDADMRTRSNIEGLLNERRLEVRNYEPWVQEGLEIFAPPVPQKN